MADGAPKKLVALIVEDQDEIREVLASVVGELGCTVRQASNGAEAVEALARDTIDLMVLDLAIPKLNGFGVLEEMRKHPHRLSQPATVVVSATADADGKVRGTELGAVDFVDKPFCLPALRRRLERVISMVRLERGLVAAEEQLQAMRARDPVTGMGTFRTLQFAIDAQFQSANIMGKPLSCVIFFDADYDRTLTEGGLDEAEERLRRMASVLEDDLRAADLVFRVDAAEFVVLLPGTPRSGAKQVAKKMRSSLDAICDNLFISVASFPHPHITQASILFRAANVTLAQIRSRDHACDGYFEGF